MKKSTVAIGFLAVLFFVAGYAFAQGSGHESRHEGMHQPGSVQQHEGSHQRHQETAAPGKDLSLTPEQKSKIQELRRKFRLENAQLIGAVVAKRIELQALWSDPRADSRAIMEKEKEMASLQFHLREKIIQAKLEARQFLTPEQMVYFGREWGKGFRKMMGHHGMMDHQETMSHGEQMGHGEMCRCRMGSGRGMRHGQEHGEDHRMGHGAGHGMEMCK
jgi:Spy/CpxP family protein refolding chaperone